MSMNPRETTDKIRTDYQDYIASILSVKDSKITDLAHKAVRNTEFVKGPYLETTLPFVEGKSLKELAEEGIVSKEFSSMGQSVHYEDWKLRIHQEQALRHIIQNERNMVVSTGTGSGKTECYLYPIFNSIMREKENGTLDSGVRALLIFPMNALANDQQKKLRKLLKEYPDITFGRYTGETERKRKGETAEQAEKRLHEEYDANHIMDSEEAYRKSIPNELMCREMMADKPPHILLTNYAMLEYMLLRPDTAPFFDTASAKNWQFIVIDEAHSYKGANGTEIAYLLRRVKERIRHNMHKPFRCIATSATLGSDEGKGDLAKFAENLFGEPFSASDVITTKRINRKLPIDGREFAPSEYVELKEQIRGMAEDERGMFLYNSLSKDFRLFKLYNALKSKPKRIGEVASLVFEDVPSDKEKEIALINLIELAAAAKKSEYDAALLPARYHLFVKSLEGMFVQYYPSKAVYLDRKEKLWSGGHSYSVFELANCQKCAQEYLVGKTIETSNGSYFVQTSNSDKPEYYFISNKENISIDEFDEDDLVEEIYKLDELKKFHLCLSCGRITPFAEKHPYDCCNNNDNGKIVTVYNLAYKGKENESNCCPCCGATKRGLIKRFLTANQPATFAIAKSLYEAIPPRPLKKVSVDDEDFDDLFDDIFWDEAEEEFSETAFSDESGRKLLIFSDNRQEAAFFAGFFDKKYNLLMWRKVILQCLREAENHTLCVSDLIKRARNVAEASGLYSFDQERKNTLTDDQKLEIASLYVMQEFISPDIQTGLEGLGYIKIEPEIFEKLIKTTDPRVAGLTGRELWDVLRFMMDTLRQKGANNYPNNIRATDDFFAPRNHAGYFRQSGSQNERNGHIYGFIPQEKTPNKRLALMSKLINDNSLDVKEKDASARENLEAVYKFLLNLQKLNYIIKTQDSNKGIVFQLNYAKWNFKLVTDKDKIYKCNKCGKTFGYSIRGICPEMKCDGILEEIKPHEMEEELYYSNIFTDNKLIPMVAKEHTAQLSSKTAGEYQKNFEEGKINVLSCSSTFEIGVDVGELEATFQRNVPPETANYIQRAGRAGRRTSSAAFSVTFSRRTSHDMTFFNNPPQIIAGKINAPILEIDNEKIAERHLNSIVVAWFFKRHPEYFNEKARKIVSFGDEVNMASELRNDLLMHPEDLIKSIHNVLPAAVCDDLDIDNWAFIDDITGTEGSLTRAISERISDIEGLKRLTDNLNNIDSGNHNFNKELGKAIAAKKVIETLDEEPSISFLSSKSVLPKYGFPIDTVSLDILSGSEEEAKKIDLSRDLKMAISEFAPSAKIVANGKIWESYAINTIPDKGWPAYIYHECPKCKKIYRPESKMVAATVNLEDEPKKRCEFCDTLMNPKLFIIPLFGFSTQMGYKPKPVGESRPNSYYSTRTHFWGIDSLTEKQKAEAEDGVISIKGKNINITYSPGGKLFVLNQGIKGRGMHICPRCGYAKDPATVIKGNLHETKYKRLCSNKSFINVSLGHEFSTDIVKIVLPNHVVNMQISEGTQPKNQNLSILYAILEGASEALGISRDDINGCITEKQELILYDDTAGGSGFVKHIYHNFNKVLRAAKNKVAGQCGCTPETSCYGCLRNYSNQFAHDEISRGIAYEYLEWLINGDVVEQSDQIKTKSETNVFSEEIGSKKLEYIAPDVSMNLDTITQLEELRDLSDDDSEKSGLKKLIEVAQDGVYENPISDNCLPASEGDIWPEIFWANSKVALFTESTREQYNILKKYDWYCYVVDENIDAKTVLSHIQRKEK